jgi:pSer/pThr/pTyr-binding forkhead associated (FHA) protein
VLPGTGLDTTMIAVVVLLGACVLLVVAIVIVRQRGAAPASRVSVAAGPKVSAGLDITFTDGRTTPFRITGTRTTIGRGEDNVVVIRDGETSTHHAEITASSEGFRLRDVGSANGTTVNGQPVTDVDLRVGDEIGVGTTRLVLTE